jgi:hypothetical protein
MKSRELAWTVGVAAVGLAIASIYAWPGYLTWDGVDQLEQARAGQYTDWHPPIMQALWRVFDHVVAGPALVFALQCELFLVGTYALIRRRTRTRWAAGLVALAIFAFPPTLAFFGVVVKDGLMCGALVAGTAGLTSERRGPRIAALVCFAFAAAVRHNGLAAVIPLVCWLSPWPASGSWWRRRLVGCLVGFAVCAAGWASNRALGPRQAHIFESVIVPMDLVGIVCDGPDLSDAEVRELLAPLHVVPEHDLRGHACELSDPYGYWEPLIRGPGRFIDEAVTPEQFDTLRGVWWHAIRSHPVAYLWERLTSFRWLMGLTDARWDAVTTGDTERATFVNTGRTWRGRPGVQMWLSRRIAKFARHSVLFRPYLYVVLSLGLLVVRRRDAVITALQLSSLGYLGLLVFVSPGADIRYAQWTMLAVTLAVALHLLALARARLGKQPPGSGVRGGADTRDVEGEQRAVADDHGAVDRDVTDVA